VNTFGVSQIELLQDEGVAIDPDGRLADFPMRRVRMEALTLEQFLPDPIQNGIPKSAGF
jgi:hypothetical protein